MSGSPRVTVDRGIVSVDGRRRFVHAVRLVPEHRGPGAIDPADIDNALIAFAAIGGNGIVVRDVEPDVDLAAVTVTAEQLGLVVLSDRLLPRPRLRGLGWVHGDERELPDRLRRSLRPTRFLGGFGAPSVAADDPLLTATDEGWRRIAGPGGAARTDDDAACIERHTPPAAFDDAHAWAQATRDYQAMVVRFHVEAARRCKYRAIGVVAPDALLDPSGGLSPALLAPSGAGKEAFTALANVARPILPIADRLPPHLHGNEALALDLHVVNDFDRPVERAELLATLTWATDAQRFRFAGSVAADAVQRIGTLSIVVPPVTGPLRLDLELHLADGPVTATYRSDIYADPHDH